MVRFRNKVASSKFCSRLFMLDPPHREREGIASEVLHRIYWVKSCYSLHVPSAGHTLKRAGRFPDTEVPTATRRWPYIYSSGGGVRHPPSGSRDQIVPRPITSALLRFQVLSKLQSLGFHVSSHKFDLRVGDEADPARGFVPCQPHIFRQVCKDRVTLSYCI